MTDPRIQMGPPAQMRLGIWGPPGSGKTTYLAALKLATLHSSVPGNWIMSGTDDTSTDLLTEWTQTLVKHQTFPTATELPKRMVFRFTGSQQITVRVKGRFSTSTRIETVPDTFELEVLDVPGGYYGKRSVETPPRPAIIPDVETPEEPHELPDDLTSDDELVDHLEQCHGVLYLFDPDRDHRLGDAFEFFHPVLDRLAARILQGRYPGTRLPHRVAVCITKFDKPNIYSTATKGGFIRYSDQEPYLPTVENWRAAEFFETLSRDPRTNTYLVAKGLKNHFDESRIGYFVTSSIGFYVADRRFRPNDAMNVVPLAPDKYRIRGRVFPINVLEPLIWLHQCLRAGQ